MTGFTLVSGIIVLMFITISIIFHRLRDNGVDTYEKENRFQLVEFVSLFVAIIFFAAGLGTFARDLKRSNIEHQIRNIPTICEITEDYIIFDVVNIKDDYQGYYYYYLDSDGYLIEKNLSVHDKCFLKPIDENKYQIKVLIKKNFFDYSIEYILYVPKISIVAEQKLE